MKPFFALFVEENAARTLMQIRLISPNFPTPEKNRHVNHSKAVRFKDLCRSVSAFYLIFTFKRELVFGQIGRNGGTKALKVASRNTLRVPSLPKHDGTADGTKRRSRACVRDVSMPFFGRQ
jgi:hypothetical protein